MDFDRSIDQYFDKNTTALAELAEELESLSDVELEEAGVIMVSDKPLEFYRGLFTGLIHGILTLQETDPDSYVGNLKKRGRCLSELRMAAMHIAGEIRRKCK